MLRKPRLFPLLLIVFGVAMLPVSKAQSPDARSLNDCIGYALDNNPQIRIAQLQLADANWRIKENKSTGLPQITASVGYQYFIQRPGIPASALGFPSDEKIAFNAYHSLSPSVQLNQLFFSNSYRVATKAADYYRVYVSEQLNVARRTVRNQVIDAYLPALLLSENLALLDKNIANLEKLLSETKAIQQAGFAEQLDVDRLELSLTALRSERDNLVRQQSMVLNGLKMAMGLRMDEPLSLSDNLNQLLGDYGAADLSSQLNPQNRPEYVQLRRARELSQIQVELQSKPWMPTVAGFVQYQPGFQGGFGDDKKWFFIPSAIAGISVNVNLFDSGGSKARRQMAQIGVQTIDEQEKLLLNSLELEVSNARKQYLNAEERVKNQQKNLALAQRIYDTTQTKFKAGVGSSFELVSAEQSLYSAQQALMTAQYDLLNAKIAVQKALGTTN
ncbi:MAG: TolC family protein [Saprospiraceae bacterium]|nr:TolC family protein [Saprospiraceae bacterium]